MRDNYKVLVCASGVTTGDGEVDLNEEIRNFQEWFRLSGQSGDAQEGLSKK